LHTKRHCYPNCAAAGFLSSYFSKREERDRHRKAKDCATHYNDTAADFRWINGVRGSRSSVNQLRVKEPFFTGELDRSLPMPRHRSQLTVSEFAEWFEAAAS
jgi:hypothetical protein